MACCFLSAFLIGRILQVYKDFDVGSDGFDEKLQSQEAVGHALEGCDEEPSFEQRNSIIKTTLSVDGLECSTCVTAVERALSRTVGVNKVRVSLALGEAIVLHDSNVAPRQCLRQIIEDLGYNVLVGGHPPQHAIALLEGKAVVQKARQALRLAFILCISMIALDEVMKYLAHRILSYRVQSIDRLLSSLALALAIQILCAAPIHQNAVKKARKMRFHMDILVSLSILLGLLFSSVNIWIYGPTAEIYLRSVSSTAVTVLAARYLQTVSRRESQSSLTNLVKLRQPTAIVVTEMGEIEAPTAILKPGDKIVVHHYALIPCDAYVCTGTSVVDESLRTGESTPVVKNIGDDVWGGTRNRSGKLEVVVRASLEDSSISKLIDSIQLSTASKTNRLGVIDQWNEAFVPFVLLAATSGFLIHLARRWESDSKLEVLNFAARRAMAILMSACPCALGLAAPSAVMAGVDVASRHGILVQGGLLTFEKLSMVTHVIMDKTGTLTSGSLRVQKTLLTEEWQKCKSLFCMLVGSAEEPFTTSHPVSSAIFRALVKEVSDDWSSFILRRTISVVASPLTGKGVTCDIDYEGVARRICVGNAELMEMSGVILNNFHDPIKPGHMSVYVAVDHKHAGTILLKDTIQRGAEATIRHLQHSLGLDVKMLTGDTEPQADRVAAALNLSVLASSATPEMKLRIVKEIQEAGGIVAMVGDGINDVLALAAADVGIMIGTGKSCSTTGGQILLLGDDLASLRHVWTISGAIIAQIRANTMWAVGYNVLSMLLSSGVVEIPIIKIEITPTIAAAMMGLSSVMISWSSLRLRDRLVHLLNEKGNQE